MKIVGPSLGMEICPRSVSTARGHIVTPFPSMTALISWVGGYITFVANLVLNLKKTLICFVNSTAKPEDVCWEELYPKFKGTPTVRYLDVGCGFGGFLVTMSQLCPDSCILGMEIRTKVAEYVRLRIESLRQKKEGAASNVAVIRTNSMLYLLNYIGRGQLDALFFAFPDPHFKVRVLFAFCRTKS